MAFANSLRALARRILRRPRAVSTHPFDTAHSVDTSGLIEGRLLATGHPHDAFNTAYFAVPPSRFRAAITQWRNTPATAASSEYIFADMGCGKGRALLLARGMGFREVIGIELNPDLARIAEVNLQKVQDRDGPGTRTRVIAGDAAASVAEMPPGRLLLYGYNPFRAPVLRTLLAALLVRQTTETSPVDFLYLYPEHENVFSEFPAFTRLWHRDIPIAHDEAPDGISSATDPCSLYRAEAVSAT